MKMKNPRTAVIMKFDDVLMMLTWVVDVPLARALVKNVHITPLKMRFREKNICGGNYVSWLIESPLNILKTMCITKSRERCGEDASHTCGNLPLHMWQQWSSL